MLSRSYLQCDAQGDLEEEIERHVRRVVETRLSEAKRGKIVDATANDEVLSMVVCHVLLARETAVEPYRNFMEDLTVADGVFLKGSRVVIPASMRSEVLDLIHEGHLGIAKCKRRARGAVYWPEMNEAIKQRVNKCATCLTNQYQQRREPLMPTQDRQSEMPWGRVAADLFLLNGRSYLVVVVYCSSFPETCLL